MKAGLAIVVGLLLPWGCYEYVRASTRNTVPATAVNVDPDSVPAAGCVEPPLPPARPRTEELDRFGQQLADYRRCVEQYVQARSVAVKQHNALARANAEAANAAVQRLTGLMTRLNGASGG